MHRILLLHMAAMLTLAAATAQAGRLPQVDEEADNTAQQRAAYFLVRRTAPYGVRFDAAVARLKAYEHFRAGIEAERTDPVFQATLASQLHTEVWQSIGPAPIVEGQTPTDASSASRSPVSGRVNAIAIDGIDKAVYIGGAQGGVWRSLNHGVSWTPLTDNLGSLAVGSLAIAPGPHPLNQGTIYLGTGEGNGSCDSYAGIGIYKSIDSGKTWQGPFGTAQFNGRSVISIVVDSADPQVLLAGTTRGVAGIGCDLALNAPLPHVGVYRSGDGGVTWTQVLPTATGDLRISRIVQDPNPRFQTIGNTSYWAAATPTSPADGGLWNSSDGGQTWMRYSSTASTAIDRVVSKLRPHRGLMRAACLGRQRRLRAHILPGSALAVYRTTLLRPAPLAWYRALSAWANKVVRL